MSVVLSGALVALCSGCAGAPSTATRSSATAEQSSPPPAPAADAPPADWLAQLAALRVAPDLPDDHTYDRARQFGRWESTGPGCTTRDAVLTSQAVATERRGCEVVGATLTDPYTGATTSGPDRLWQIDHVVPPGLAWRSGARTWTAQRRHAFFLDRGNLLAVNAHDNLAKSDDGPERWMPRAGRCAYAVRFVRGVLVWQLTVTPARRAALSAACS